MSSEIVAKVKTKTPSQKYIESIQVHVANRNTRRLAEKECKDRLSEHCSKYKILPKEKASVEELVSMIKMVLEEGKNGTSAIREYAKIHTKGEKWVSEVAKPNAGKLFKGTLSKFDGHKVVVTMKRNNVYREKNILNKTVTSALTELSKQLKVSKVIDGLREEVTTLKKSIAFKEEGKDWKEHAQELRNSGKSLSEISGIVGKSKSAVGQYTTAQK